MSFVIIVLSYFEDIHDLVGSSVFREKQSDSEEPGDE
jgi:hypothetical protein